MERAVTLGFAASNNEAEYEALLSGLRTAKELGIKQLVVHCDSQLVANQLNGEYTARDDRMIAYVKEAQRLIQEIGEVMVKQVGREENAHADSLASLASAVTSELRREIVVDFQPSPTIGDQVILCAEQDTIGRDWMTPIAEYLRDGLLPEDEKEGWKVRRKADRLCLSPEGKLYRHSYSGPYLLCLSPTNVENLLWEIHEGSCGGHVGGRSLAHRAMSQGYWWPYMQQDVLQFVQKCDRCYRFAKEIHQLAGQLNSIVSPGRSTSGGSSSSDPCPGQLAIVDS